MSGKWSAWMALTAACVVAVGLGGLRGADVARAATCVVVPYPGDDAPRAAIAGWMAAGALPSGLPGELPVMAALVESDLRNLPEGAEGSGDSAGYFQMRTSIWDTGEYAGYRERPDLQLRWFVEYATKVRQTRIASGLPDPAADENGWGDWIADVERPAAQYRGRYQLRLAEARALLATSSCAGAVPPALVPPAGGSAPPDPTPPAEPVADEIAPVVRLDGPRRQRALLSGLILVGVRCPAERCVATATGTLALPGAARPLRLRAKPARLRVGQRGALRLALGPRGWSAVRRALRTRRSVRADVRVVVADAADNRSTRRLVVQIAR